MPSFRRQSVGPVIVHPKSPRSPTKDLRVGFAKGYVTGVSRPINDNERYVLGNFETHARKCSRCHRPYDVYRNGEQLCEAGHRLAQDVAVFLYNKDGDSYSTQHEEHRVVHVEVPLEYEQARSLLRAVERSLRHRRRRGSLAESSYDNTYYIPARRSEKSSEPASPKLKARPVQLEQDTKRHRRHSVSAPQIVNWQEQDSQATIEVAKRERRGSLYAQDLAERKRTNYNIEVREPSARDYREHRSAGYYR